MNLLQTSQACLGKNDYAAAIDALELAVSAEPGDIEPYLVLGLAYLLEGKEDAAQTAWLCGISQAEESTLSQWECMLSGILTCEAERQFQQNNFEYSWLLRQHLRELEPKNSNNLLQLLQLELQLKKFSSQNLIDWNVITILQEETNEEINQNILCQLLEEMFEYYDQQILAFAKVCFPLLQPQAWVNSLLNAVNRLSKLNTYEHYGFAIEALKLVLEFQRPSLDFLGRLWDCYRKISSPKEIEVAQQFSSLCLSLPEKYLGSRLLLDSYLRCGKWLEIEPIAENYHQLMEEMITLDVEKLDLVAIKQLLYTLSLYLRDDLVKNGGLRNKAAAAFHKKVSNSFACREAMQDLYKPVSNVGFNKKLKIGFLSHTLRNHSVGWLSRWFFKYLNNEKFEYSIYLQRMKPENTFFQQWFAPHVSEVFTCTDYVEETAELIAKSRVDILIDLDGPTLDLPCFVLALKPAPIQASWLGWDASGLPTIDYFIADPYVLPDNAQDYYQEKILRLPRTYIAVEGFESDVPDLKRSDLNISADAIVYFSSQRAIKQHPDVIQAQMQIIKEVPNSYLLIKAGADRSMNEDYFVNMADRVGISLDQVRFLGRSENEFIHRANMRIADVVLDTFPYNGATTTLEALWMGLPLVTKVGEQFTARYSYAFLKNVGVEEGIAYSDAEYIEWGVRFGTDERLRQQVAWKLRQSRHTSPLWQPKQFARDMENAFLQMWQTHVEMKVA